MNKTLMTAAVAVLMLACGGMPEEEGTFDDVAAATVADASSAQANDADEAIAGSALKSKTNDTKTDDTKTNASAKKKKTEPATDGGTTDPGTGTTSSFATLTTDLVEPGVAPTWKSSFAIAETWSVEIATDIPASSAGHHVLDVYVYSPSGATYEAFTVRFAAGTAAGADELQAEPTANGYRLWASLPVIGTFIDSYHMAGTWKAQSWLDGVGPRSSAEFQLQ